MTLSNILDQVYGHNVTAPQAHRGVSTGFTDTRRGQRVRAVTKRSNGQTSVGSSQLATVSTSLRTALTARDCHCRFPGCHTTRQLEAYLIDRHQSTHVSGASSTSTENLVMLCNSHFEEVVNGGYKVVRGSDGAFTFMRCHLT